MRRGAYWPFVLPSLLLFALLFFYPVVMCFYYGFTFWEGFSNKPVWNGGGNFRTLWEDTEFHTAVWNTFKFTLFNLVFHNLLALGAALLLNMPFRTKGALRTLVFIPVMISPVVAGYAMSYVFNGEGALNKVLNAAGLSPFIQDWMGNLHITLYVVAAAGVWQYFAFHMIIYLAGLQGISKDFYEAARIDGARAWQCFTRITFPMLAPAFTINIVLATIGGLKIFDTVFVMTNGGPGYATETIVLRIYKEAFMNWNMGYASAQSLTMFLLVLMISLVQLLFLRKREVQL